MKKLCFALLLIACTLSYSQKGSNYGIRGGFNYNANGHYFESINENAKNPDRNIGYHIGVFGKIGNRLYVKPELVFTKIKSDYNSDSYILKTLDAPVLVGLKIIGPISVFGGPSFQYIIKSKFDDITFDNLNNDFSLGLNIGFALHFNKIGVDVRYDRGFNSSEVNFLHNNNIDTSRIDTRPEQLVLSFSVAL